MAKLKEDFGLHSTPEESGQDASVFLFISLYSLLLAFFILLFTYATVSKHKAEVVSGSVKKSFLKGEKSDLQKEQVPLSPYGQELLLEKSYGEIRRVSKELLAIEDANIIQDGDRLILRLPVFLLFPDDSTQIDDKKLFIEKMADSVTTSPQGLQLDIEFKMPRLPEVKTLDALTVNRSGSFARMLVQMGVPENAIYVGMSEGEKEMVEITFSPRNVDSTRMEFSVP